MRSSITGAITNLRQAGSVDHGGRLLVRSIVTGTNCVSSGVGVAVIEVRSIEIIFADKVVMGASSRVDNKRSKADLGAQPIW